MLLLTGLVVLVSVSMCAASPISARQQEASTVLELSSVSWKLRSPNVSVPAKVPSHVHLDLLSAGLINEPTYADNDFQQRWIGFGNFTYESAALTNLSKSPDVRTYLIFDGIDTFADIKFGSLHIASANNQFRQWSFDVSKQLQNSSDIERIIVGVREPQVLPRK